MCLLGEEAMGSKILLYIPNIIGYIRVILTVAAFLFYHQEPHLFIILYGVSITLDGLDGYVARKLQQCSEFGAWFDVVVDLFSRGLLWCSVHQYGYLVMFVEWLTFVCTHCRGARWRIPEDHFPWLVTRVMANGFKTAWGVVAIGGLHLLPLWLYAWKKECLTTMFAMPFCMQVAGGLLLTAGRIICMLVELFYIKNHIESLLENGTDRTEN